MKDIRLHDDRQAGGLAQRFGVEGVTMVSHILGPDKKLRANTSDDTGVMDHEATDVVHQLKQGHLTRKQSLERPVVLSKWSYRKQSPAHKHRISSQLENNTIQLYSTHGLNSDQMQPRQGKLIAQREEQTAGEVTQTEGESSETAPSVDAEIIANVVYRMMMRDLVIEKERRA